MKQGKFEMEVLVGGVPLQEFKSEQGETWVEASFKTPVTYRGKPETEKDPHGETYEQSWPVTPYTIKITNNSSETVYCKVFIDGKEASWEYAHPQRSVEIKGFRDMSNRLQVYNEFLFQLPRRLFSDEKEKLVLSDAERAAMKKQLESIRVEISAAELEYTREEVDAPTNASKGKFDAINKATAEATAATSTSGAGRLNTDGCKWGTRTYNYYKIHGVIQNMVIRYAQRAKLEMLGILAPANPADPKWATSRKKRAADEAAAAAAAAGGASSGAGAGAGPGASAAAAAASPPAVKVKAEGAKRQRAADDEVVDLCD